MFKIISYIFVFSLSFFSVASEAITLKSTDPELVSLKAQQNNMIMQTVYVGWSGVHSQEHIRNINQKNKKSTLASLKKNIRENTIPTLSWSENPAVKNAVNVGGKSHPLYLCSAAFPKVIGNQSARYPGEWKNNYCVITVHHQEHDMKKSRVLIGVQKTLRWISLDVVIKKMLTQLPAADRVSSPQYPLGFNLENFDFDIVINHYHAIACGDEGDNPVLACRINNKNKILIGKMIFEGNALACVTAENNQVILSSNHFDILFGKKG